MIALTALTLLAVVALLLLRPGGMTAGLLRDAAYEHPRFVIGFGCLLAVALSIGGLWPSPERLETDVEGYGELWHMVQTSPGLRDAARARMNDGMLTGEELQDMRKLYRNAPDIETMRSGVTKELSR